MAAGLWLRVVAAATAALGAFALVTATPWAAAAGGVGAIVTAVVAVWSADSPRRDDAAPEKVGTNEDLVSRSDRADLLTDDADLDSALRSRLGVARQALHPLSMVQAEVFVDDGAPAETHQIRDAAGRTLRDSDLVGRRSDGTFVFILEDTGEDGAVWTTERLRRHLNETIAPSRFVAGIASYPAHGLEAEDLAAKTAAALDAAREWPQDRIEVATGT